jgi:hypothetical protein
MRREMGRTHRRGRPRRSNGEGRAGILDSDLTQRQRNERRRKATELVESNSVAFCVPSQSQEGVYYIVTGPPFWTCSCDDFGWTTGDCKHSQACRMTLAKWLRRENGAMTLRAIRR